MADEKLADVSVAKGVFIIITALVLTNVVMWAITTGIPKLMKQNQPAGS